VRKPAEEALADVVVRELVSLGERARGERERGERGGGSGEAHDVIVRLFDG
jgi:hypothetical protein